MPCGGPGKRELPRVRNWFSVYARERAFANSRAGQGRTLAADGLQGEKRHDPGKILQDVPYPAAIVTEFAAARARMP